jgi:hypothetical protein
MATARNETREREVKTTVKEPVVVLEISPDEAQTLISILFRVGGDYIHSRRKHADQLYRALSPIASEPTTKDMQGSIFFSS